MTNTTGKAKVTQKMEINKTNNTKEIKQKQSQIIIWNEKNMTMTYKLFS